MVGRTKPPTKADRRRFDALQQMGCISCRLEGRAGVLPQIHHITDRGRRMGHQYTIPLCPWHHQAIPLATLTTPETERIMGPSLERSKAAFTERYGTELELLERVNQALEVAA